MDPGQRALLFREVNERIYELLVRDPDLPGEFLCECGRDCERRVLLMPAAYVVLRDAGAAVQAPECRRGGKLRLRIRDGAPHAGAVAAA